MAVQPLNGISIIDVAIALNLKPKYGQSWNDREVSLTDNESLKISTRKNVWTDWGGTPNNRAARSNVPAGGGILDLVGYILDCDKKSALHWLEAAGLLGPRSPCAPQTQCQHILPATRSNRWPQVPERVNHDPKRLLVADLLWTKRQAVSVDPLHPARMWAAWRHLWHPLVAWPRSIGWLQQNHCRHDGAGSLVMPLAPLDAWLRAYPDVPTPNAVQLVHVGNDGRPVLDRPREGDWLNKRTFGPSSGGSVCLIGTAFIEETIGVVEGLADGLAVASRERQSVIVAAGLSGMGKHLAHALATQLRSIAVRIYPDLGPTIDKATGEPKQPLNYPGLDRARKLKHMISAHGGSARVMEYGDNRSKDPAELTAE